LPHSAVGIVPVFVSEVAMPRITPSRRSREWKADATALELTANRDAFIGRDA